MFVAILSVNFVSAWWNTFECEGFSVDIPEGLTKANGYTPTTPPNHVPLVSTDRSKWDYNNMEIELTPLHKAVYFLFLNHSIFIYY